LIDSSLKILDITDNYPGEKHADLAGIFIHRQFIALSHLGCDIRVVNPQPLISRQFFSPHYPYRSIKNKISVYRPKFIYFPKLLQPGRLYEYFYSLAVQSTIKRNFINWIPDIIICDWITPCGYAGVRSSIALKVPLILRARGGDVRFIKKSLPKSSNYYQKIGSYSKLIIANGYGLQEDLISTNIFYEEHIRVISNGIDTNLFNLPSQNERIDARVELNIPLHAQVWLFVGTWDIHKGTKEIAKVIPKLMNNLSNVYFLVAGPIRDKESYVLMKNYGERVQFLGMVDSEKIKKCLHSADIFILPSHAEGLPNSLMEAMSCGVAPVVSNVGGVPGIIKNEVNGLLFNPGDEKMLEKQLTLCSMNEELRKKISKNAHQTIHDLELDMDSVVYKLFTILIKISIESKQTTQ